MKNKRIVWIGGLLAALVLVAVIGATSVYAQGPTPTEPPRDERGPGGRGPLGGPGMEAAAQVLGMTTDELTAALKEGKTIKQLAEEKGVDFADLQVSIQAVRGDEKFGRGPLSGPGLEAAAQVLGMATDELTAALKEGKTLEQLAEEKGIDFADVQTAMQAVHETEMRARIQQALDEGTITQEHADWLLEGLDKGFLGKPGGFGMGFDGPRGPGQGPAPADGAQPTQESRQ